MDKEYLRSMVIAGVTTREIEKITGVGRSTVSYYIKKYGFTEQQMYRKPTYVQDFFKKINTKEQAYILGFLCGDGNYLKDGGFSISIAKNDLCILEFIQKNIGGNIIISNTLNLEKKIFPHVSMSFKYVNYINDLKKYGVFDYKINRKIPIIKEEFYPYLLLGFFDAEGCVSFGYRDDRMRVWQKISFTSSLSLLLGIQKILDMYKISTAIKPKGKEKCYDIVFCDVNRVTNFLDIIYPDDTFIVLKRKYEKAIALRRKLGEFRETSARSGGGNPEPSMLS